MPPYPSARSPSCVRGARRRPPLPLVVVLLAGCQVPHAPRAVQSDHASGDHPARAALAGETHDWLAGATRSPLMSSALEGVSASGVASGAAPGIVSGAVPSTTPPHSPPLVTLAAVAAPLDTLLVALARDAGVELALHSVPEASVTLALEPQPLTEVLARLAAHTPFHWRLDGTRLTVRGDVPFTDTYAVDYLNLDRTTRGSVGLATRVGSIDAGGGAIGASGGIANSSETRIENVGEHRFWNSLARDVSELFADERDAVRWSVNRDVGLVTLRGRPMAHTRLADYLDALHASAQRQVLIEATVIEVALSDSFEAGIDWQVIASGLTGLSAAQVLGGQAAVTADSVGRLVAPAGLVSLVQRSGDGELGATLSLLERFGDVRILSRPRIIALNNQSSVLKVVDNRVYFTARVERRIGEEGDEIVTGTDIHTVPVGLVMNVTPFISAGGAVMLNVRPTLSRILGFVDDPNPELALANVTNGVPEIQVREMESMLRVQSGDTAIIGGLMQETRRLDERALPGLARLPLIGGLFSRNHRDNLRTELLVVLRPTVMAAPPRVARG